MAQCSETCTFKIKEQLSSSAEATVTLRQIFGNWKTQTQLAWTNKNQDNIAICGSQYDQETTAKA